VDIRAIEEKIRQVMGRCQNLERENALLQQQLAQVKQQINILRDQKQLAINQVEDLVARLKTFAGTNT